MAKYRIWSVAGFIIMGLLSILVLAGCGPPVEKLDHTSCEDIIFYSEDEPVDAILCLPAGPQQNLPAVVFLHGIGAFEPWDPEIEDTMAYDIHKEFAENGFVALSILYFSRTPPPAGPLPNTFTDADYRDLVKARPIWITTIEDGLRFIQSMPEVDPDRIGLIGYSLGGGLALGLDQDLNDYSTLVSISGFIWMDEDYDYLTAGDTPTLILQAEEDDMITMWDANYLKDILEEHGIEHELVVIPGADHRWLGQEGEEGFEAILEFLDSH